MSSTKIDPSGVLHRLRGEHEGVELTFVLDDVEHRVEHSQVPGTYRKADTQRGACLARGSEPEPEADSPLPGPPGDAVRGAEGLGDMPMLKVAFVGQILAPDRQNPMLIGRNYTEPSIPEP